MLHHISGRNVHSILPKACDYILEHGKGTESRNGPVLTLEGLTVIEYLCPEERVMFHQLRDANPFFHFAESLWMLDGRNDVKFVSKFVKTIANYSDNGLEFNAAYGHRWRNHFGRDQLKMVRDALIADKTCRRQYIGIWDARHDLGLKSKDLPCNLGVVPRITEDGLDITVWNRSNDLIWGALGANAVHFSFLQEWLARAINVPVARYFQVSTNMHLYVKPHLDLAESFQNAADDCPYSYGDVEPFPIMSIDSDKWLRELNMLLDADGKVVGLTDPFFRKVAMPLFDAWECYKEGDMPMALNITHNIADKGWSRACREWLERRKLAKARADRAQDDGVQYED